MLKHQGLIESWHDRRIKAGSSIDGEIDRELEKADLILLLVSSSFLASDYCFSREMKRAMERHSAGSATVIPVIVRPCEWQSAPFGKLMATPKDGKPIITWPHHDEAYAEVARKVREIVEEKISTLSRPREAELNTPLFVRSVVQPRSSNLRLKKEFTELDLDNFLRETFEFIERYFQGSLAELEIRNSGIECHFTKESGSTFLAAVYKGGKKAAECSITLGSGRFRNSSILFSYDASARGNNFNESLSVEVDDQSMYLKPLGMTMRASGEKLSQEGGAEFLWTLLIERLQ